MGMSIERLFMFVMAVAAFVYVALVGVGVVGVLALLDGFRVDAAGQYEQCIRDEYDMSPAECRAQFGEWCECYDMSVNNNQ